MWRQQRANMLAEFTAQWRRLASVISQTHTHSWWWLNTEHKVAGVHACVGRRVNCSVCPTATVGRGNFTNKYTRIIQLATDFRVVGQRYTFDVLIRASKPRGKQLRSRCVCMLLETRWNFMAFDVSAQDDWAAAACTERASYVDVLRRRLGQKRFVPHTT